MNVISDTTANTAKAANGIENLPRMLNPRSIAMVGVSRDPDSFGYPLVEIAQRDGYQGAIYLVNPNADMILGLKCYPSVLAIPDEIDLAIIMVPRKITTAVLEECIEKGVKGIVIVTAGFAEQSTDGGKHQSELAAMAAEKGIRIIGPNTLGFFSAPSSLDVMMSGFIKKGSIALMTQSGNLTMSLTFPGGERGFGFSYVVDLGNQADLQPHDLLRFFREDKNTKAVAIHIEGLRDGRRFLREVRETVKVKPVVVLKTGRTEAGARAVMSHTASIAGDDRIYTAAIAQAGAIQVDGFVEFNSVLLAFNHGRPARGNRVCIISEGGGDCALAADACIRNGLDIPELSGESRRRLNEIVPATGSTRNPVDLASWENVVEATEIALEDDSIDGVLVVGGFAGFYLISPKDLEKEERYVARMCELLKSARKPVIIYSYFGYRPNPLMEKLRTHGIPLFMDHHDAVNAMAALVRYERTRVRMQGRGFPADPPVSGADPRREPSCLLHPEARRLLERYGLAFPDEKMTNSPSEASAAASEIGFPVVVKVISRDILHKSDSGCVKTGLNSAGETEDACVEVLSNAKAAKQDADITGVLVAKMVTQPGVDVIIGGVRDPVFGPVIMFGLGGIYVEVMNDVSLRVCPIDDHDADEMIREIKGYALLAGARGGIVVDIPAIKRALMGVSRLMLENPEIEEIDLNPIRVHEKGLQVLDTRIISR